MKTNREPKMLKYKNAQLDLSRTAGRIGIMIFMLTLAACAQLGGNRGLEPDWCVVQASAPFRPVDKPGMQRREAQNDAEQLARRELFRRVGALTVDGKRTVNDIIARDTRLRAEILHLIRTAEVMDWQVDSQHGCVRVWLRLDLNRVRALFQPPKQPN